MAIKHILQLDIPETACENILRVVDTSIYGDQTLLPVVCQQLDITLPGTNQPVYITTGLTPNFCIVLDAVDLGIDCPPGSSIPDGIYTIRYSISPNDLSYVTYYHLRTTKTLNRYYGEICKLHLQECEPSSEEKQKLDDLRYIKMLIDSAKAKVEYCHAPEQGIDMLAYANKLLDKYIMGCCITCR
jgi:hypothetical protein